MKAEDAKEARRINDVNDQVWDMVLYLVNPVFLYVVFQILIVSHLGGHPFFRRFEWPIFIGQFFGAWAVFYSTLLRDMGHRSRAGFILGLLAFIGCVSQYFLLPSDAVVADRTIAWFMSLQLLPAIILWTTTFFIWRRKKREWMAAEGAGS